MEMLQERSFLATKELALESHMIKMSKRSVLQMSKQVINGINFFLYNFYKS